MAASPNPLQGSLFKSEEKSIDVDADENKSSNLSNEKLANKELQNDAYLRPRSKKSKKNLEFLPYPPSPIPFSLLPNFIEGPGVIQSHQVALGRWLPTDFNIVVLARLGGTAPSLPATWQASLHRYLRALKSGASHTPP